ncbi:sugar ABC transporter ATP-binding protein [Rhodopseudomonas sp.]|uniref:sugar ABC transporter ATP-binding protein n=1 Tax=Rhodopseudomonas sp. TaxID=1078 RepID=UPI003B3A8B8B
MTVPDRGLAASRSDETDRLVKSTVAIKVRNVSKTFPGVHALRNVNFQLDTGEVHGLVGANGAGKSTFIRVLTGAEFPDEGELEIEGEPFLFDDPRRQKTAGIAAIYQELTIVPQLSAASNVFLGNVPHRGWVTNRRRMLAEFKALARRMGVEIDPDVKADTLSVANQQMLEVMRGVQANRNILIMDEPTAPLGPVERTRLYELIARLKASQVSIVFISHDLDEVLRLCDRVSVMREGQLVDTRPSAEWSKHTLVQTMLEGVEIGTLGRRSVALGGPLLEVAELSVPGRVGSISFDVREGEVFGIAGLVGSGRSELLQAIAGAEPTARGHVSIGGLDHALPLTVRRAIEAGIALAPEDRKRQGLVLSRSSLSNLLLADMKSIARGQLIDFAKRRREGERLADRLGFKRERLDFDALHLSGGNQQKLVLGKWLHRKPRLLLLDEPTRGIDLGAKQEIFTTIRKLSADGMGVILVSSDLEEVVEHSDRVLVLMKGRQLAILDRSEASVERILSLIFAVDDRTSNGALQ